MYYSNCHIGNEQPWAKPPPHIELIQKIDPLARKPYKTFTQQDKICAKGDISAEAIDGEVKEKEDNISKLVDRLSQQMSDEQIKKES